MDQDRYRRVKALVQRALELQEPERSAFLDRECENEPGLREEVDRLLADPTELPQLEQLWNEGDDATRTEAGEDVRSGARIGPYRLLQKIGEGGMGEVWVAEQTEPLRRRVALKVIKRGMDSDAVVARFEAERQALALMDHPAIAKVHDAGQTPGGRPYFVMEHIDGVSITEYCDRHALPMAERLDLFVRVCEGVQHAHQKAVIHRDLKPSNVLVSVKDGNATPKIIDFGVAKATAQRLTEKTVYTELGVLIGTPAYMSPEQADMTGENVDTRTDVYSLGVLLYELLTGALPFDPRELRSAGFDEIRRRIREVDPPRPSTRLENLPGDTSTASAKNRDTLPATLVRQLRRELDWITMRALEKDRTRRYATPSELATDIGRFLRDEPVLAGPPSGLYRAKKYVKRHAWGVTAASLAVAGLAAFAVMMAIQSARIADERDAARQAEAELQDVASFQAGMINGIDAKAAGRRVTANLAARIADAHRERGASEEQVAAALAAHEALLDGVNMTDVALDLLDENILARAVQTLEDRFADQPLVDARLRKVIGDTYRTLGRLEPAETQLRRSLETRKRLLGDDHPYTLASTQNLAKLYKDQRRFDEAEELFLQALRGRERTLGPDDPSVLSSRGNLANVYMAQRRFEEAEPLLLESLAAWRRVAGDDDRRTIIMMNNLGVFYLKQGRFDEAEPLFIESLDARRRLFGDDDLDTLVSMHNLALVYRNQDRFEDAEALLVEVLDKRRRLLGDVHPETIRCMHNLALAYRDLGRTEEAAELEALVERARRQD